MQLIRFAILELETNQKIDLIGLIIEGVSLSTVPSSSKNKKTSFLVIARCGVDKFPLKDDAGRIVINHELRSKCECAVDTLANLLSVFYGCSKSVLSPSPCVALEYENDEESDYLHSSKGILIEQRVECGFRMPVKFNSDLINSLSDRLDGVALLSEVYCNSESGQYREYVRFFELAFSLPFTQLSKKLYDFLKPRPFGYTKAEIHEWISLRHPSTHADMKKTQVIALTRDVQDHILRMEQASLDLLFNKASWQDKSVVRRDKWRPTAWTTSKEGKPTVVKGETGVSMVFRVYDEFGIYPKNIQASLSDIKENWYCTFNADGLPTTPPNQ